MLLGISPAIWRRVVVRSDSTLGDLHYAIQIAMGWSDDHLHQFLIHGTWYTIPRHGWSGWWVDFEHGRVVVCGDPDTRLATFDFRVGERFLYEYGFHDSWQHQIRVERKLPFDREQDYPVCIEGKRRAPPEDCGGPWRFMALRDRYTILDFARCLKAFLSCEDDDALGDLRAELAHVLNWVDRESFDREVNRRLRRHASSEDVFALILG